ncbi:DUF5788 family protein [Methanomethylovorans sp.]|uniref:DUF5788 family protein n=1 Tax=Methanomethylovorans sp. TaxID=2758717 RepID=UPI00351BFBD3
MASEDKITDNERNMLLNRLHRPLFWVGENIPREVEIEGKKVKLHEIIWEIVNKTLFSKADIKNIDHFLSLLKEKEREYERALERDDISYEEARNLFNETAGIMRAIMDLTQIEEETQRKKSQDTKHVCEDVEEKEWEHLVKEIITDKDKSK